MSWGYRINSWFMGCFVRNCYREKVYLLKWSNIYCILFIYLYVNGMLSSYYYKVVEIMVL